MRWLEQRAHVALFVRVLIALSTATVFQPDEYFQSLEPAHHLVFGYGHLTWEWRSPRPIRSILYPALNVPVYWLLKATSLDKSPVLGDWLVINLPRLVHGALAALTDIFLCSLVRKTIGERYVSTTLLVSLTSLFHALSLSRSLSNSLETSLTTIALSYYPWLVGPNVALDRSQLKQTLWFAALACAIRPTNAVIWVYLVVYLLWQSRTSTKTLVAIVTDGLAAAITTATALYCLDSWYYQRPTFAPWNFLITNMSNVSLFYGGNPWHYYLSQAIPILCTTALPFTLHTTWRTIKGYESRPLSVMLGCILWTISVYSLAGHKEWRFIHPLLPLLHLFASRSLYDISQTQTKSTARHLRVFLLITLPASLYIVLLYCSGPIEVMAFLRRLPREDLTVGGVGFLMPCHSTPGQAYLHREELADGKLWALGCEPPLDNQELAAYRDQTTVFFQSPHEYLTRRFPAVVNPAFPASPFPASIPGVRDSAPHPWVHEWPRYLVFFGALLQQDGVQHVFEERGYKEVWSGGRSWEGDSDERKGGVRVWRYSDIVPSS
ncbi:Mannosyltransferase [Mycena chlorophos]|uniref:Mannosyltransferase n=1 Tax=Mycena chlorophos TaxID=658473 RepID=A0A8H6WSK2_MYCCL|nr:Mannosyltransferase [Mycena chlorophos]